MEVQELLMALHSTDATTQRMAVVELSQQQAKIAVPEVVLLLASPDPALRSLSASFLGQVADRGDREVGEQLIPLLQDDEELVRSDAALALGLLHYRQAISALSTSAKDDAEWLVRVQALEALDCFRDPSLFPIFQWVLAHDEEHTVQRYAADGIHSIAEPEQIPIIQQDIETYKEDPEIIVRLILALYRLGVTGSLDRFLQLLASVMDYDTLYYCLHSLTKAIKGQVPPHMIADFPRIATALDELTQHFPDIYLYRDELKGRFQHIQAGNIISPDGCC